MQWEGLYISGTGTYLPPPVTAETAVEQGWLKRDDADDDGMISATVAGDESAPEMAVKAARQALERSGENASDVAAVMHASIYHQGQDIWTPASYIQRETIGGDAFAVQIQQGSNGGLAALELAAAFLASSPDRTAALVTTADKFCLPGFDRWNADSGQFHGDGGTAVVLSRRSGFARLKAAVSTSDPELEEVYRGADGFTDVPHQNGGPLDLSARRLAYIQTHDPRQMRKRLVDGVTSTVERTLADAHLTMDEITWVVLPNVGRTMLQWEFLLPLGIRLDRTTWDWGRRVSHLGPGDQFAGLDHLATEGRLGAGDRVLLVGVGIGFCWTGTVVEVDASPSWGPGHV